MAKGYSPLSWVPINTILFPLLLFSRKCTDSKFKWPLFPRHTNASCLPAVCLCSPLLLMYIPPRPLHTLRVYHLTSWTVICYFPEPLYPGEILESRESLSLYEGATAWGGCQFITTDELLEASGCSSFSRDVIPKKQSGKYQKFRSVRPIIKLLCKSVFKYLPLRHTVICGTFNIYLNGFFCGLNVQCVKWRAKFGGKHLKDLVNTENTRSQEPQENSLNSGCHCMGVREHGSWGEGEGEPSRKGGQLSL